MPRPSRRAFRFKNTLFYLPLDESDGLRGLPPPWVLCRAAMERHLRPEVRLDFATGPGETLRGGKGGVVSGAQSRARSPQPLPTAKLAIA